MKTVLITLIHLYQRFLSPHKGFKCAHHALHKSGSCSDAVIDIIQDQGLWQGRADIRQRFKSCRAAHHTLRNKRPIIPHGDLSCDLPCDFSFDGCGNFGLDGGLDSSSSCACDILSELIPGSTHRRHRRLIAVILILFMLFLGYWFYGRGVSSVYVMDVGKNPTLLSRLTQRETPEIRLLLIEDGRKFYSNIRILESKNTEYRFEFKRSPLGTIESLQVLDARVNLGEEKLVLSQVLDTFNQPEKVDIGKRFSYRIKRRWHLY